MSEPTLLRYLAAFGLALPVSAIGWFELIYLFFGVTFGVAFAWPLLGTVRPAEVVRRSCRLGGIAATR